MDTKNQEYIEITKIRDDGEVIIIQELEKKYQNTSKKFLLTAKAAAKLLGYSGEHFSRLKKVGEAPEATQHGNRDFYTLESLKEWGMQHGIDISNVRLTMD